jgi:hypothetical protein
MLARTEWTEKSLNTNFSGGTSNAITVLDRSGNIVRQVEGLRQKPDDLKNALKSQFLAPTK